MNEIERRKVTVLPIRLDHSPLPGSIKDKLAADFRGLRGWARQTNSVNQGSEVTNHGSR